METEALRHSIDSLDDFGRYKLAKKPDTPAEILAFLASDPDELVRRGVAESPNTPLEVLFVLTGDKSEWVRLAVISSGYDSRPRVFFHLLKDDPSHAVREEVALNHQCPAEVMEEIATGQDHFMKKSLLKNHVITDTCLTILANDDDDEIASTAQSLIAKRSM